MFKLLEVLTNFIDAAWDTFVRNHFPNHTMILTFYGERHLHELVRTLHNRENALDLMDPRHRTFEEFWDGFNAYYRCMCRDFHKFLEERSVEVSFYNNLQTTGIYMVTIRQVRTRRIIYRGVVRGLCTIPTLTEKDHLDDNTTII